MQLAMHGCMYVAFSYTAANPVFPFNETALTAQAMALGTPVNTYLRSDAFTAPEGVEVSDKSIMYVG